MTKNKERKQQEVKKYLVYAVMFIAFGCCIWWIFAPSKTAKDNQQKEQGYNDEIPAPSDQGLPGDKRAAYEMDNLEKRKGSRMMTLNDYSLFPEEESEKEAVIGDAKPDVSQPAPSHIESSVSTYQDISRSLGSFYVETDQQEQEILALEWRIQELEKKQDEDAARQSLLDEQVALMEKSYEMAARYLPVATQPAAVSATLNADATAANGKKWIPVAIDNITNGIISALPQQYNTEELISRYDRPLNADFITVGVFNTSSEVNTIKACIHSNQSVLSGQSVFVRLLEAVRIDKSIIPENTLLTGQVTLQGERLHILISSIEHDGNIYPVELTAYDNDGTQGIYVPSMMELDAVKEMIANMGTSMSGITITDNAGSQIAADLTRGLMQGTSQLFAKKLRMQKVNLKAGHNILLMADRN